MFIKKTSKEDRLDIIWNKVKRNEDVRAQTDLKQSKHMLSLFQSCHVVCFVGMNMIQILSMTETGHFKRKSVDVHSR